jgi:hypothetical protein
LSNDREVGAHRAVASTVGQQSLAVRRRPDAMRGVPLGFGASDELLHVGEVSYEAKHRERKKGCAMVVVIVVGKMAAVSGRFHCGRRVSGALVR